MVVVGVLVLVEAVVNFSNLFPFLAGIVRPVTVVIKGEI
jgi:hypothetical protein